jgi:hypothetical protein
MKDKPEERLVPAAAPLVEPPAAGETLLVATSDIHGLLEEDPIRGRLGLAKLVGFLTRLRQGAGRVHLVDCGDAFSGSAFSSIGNGRMVAAALGLAGYEAMTLGNHEFDFNPDEDDPLHPFSTLFPLVGAAGWPKPLVLAQNPSFRGAPIPGVASGPVILGPLAGGGRLVAVGVHNPATKRRSLREALADYDLGWIRSGQDGRRRITDDLEKALEPFGPGDAVAVLSHLGSGRLASDQMAGTELASVGKVSIVIDGHDHVAKGPFCPLPGPGVYLNCGRGLEAVALARFSASGGPPEAALLGYGDLRSERPDRRAASLVEGLSIRLGLGERLAELPVGFVGHAPGPDRPPMGRLAVWAILEATGADLAILNQGAIQGGLGGTVTRGDVLRALPYQDSLVVVEPTGESVLGLVDRMLKDGPEAFPHLAGLTVEGLAAGGGRLAAGLVRDLGGAPIDPGRRYRLASSVQMLRRLRGGGAGAVLDHLEQRTVGLVETIFIEGLVRLGPERIRDLAGRSALILPPCGDMPEGGMSWRV